jgi:hypothetical protein
MEPELDRPASADAPDTPAPPETRSSHRRRFERAFTTSALLSTTAVLVAIDPKIPPFRAD